MFVTRVLSQNDYKQIVEINNIHSKIMGFKKPDEYNNNFLRVIQNYFIDSSRCLVGAFDGEQLLCFIGLIDWPHAPYWTFTSAKSRRMQHVFSSEKSGLADIVAYGVRLKEKNNRHIYWAVSSKKHYPMMTLRWRRSVQELNDFKYISRTIPAGYKPQDRDVWSLMGKRTWSVELILRVAVRSGYEMQLKRKLSVLDILNEDLKNEDTGRIIRL